MSTIRVDNFGPSAGGTTYSARGIAKAWVNFNGTGTIAARDSENVSSLTDNGIGKFAVNFTNNFSDANYCTVSQCGYVDATGNNASLNVFDPTGLSVSSAPYISQIASGVNEDRPSNFAANFGDLA